MTLKLLKIPEDFYFDDHFQVDEESLRIFLTAMQGFVEYTGEVRLEKVDVEKTIKSHSGDARIWFEGGYYDFDAVYVIMECKYYDYFDNIFILIYLSYFFFLNAL